MPPSSSSSSLFLSHHAATRIRQRGLRASDVALVVAHGSPVRGGILLRTRDVATTEAEMKRTVSRLHRLAGTFVAVADDTVLSAFRPTKLQRRKMLAAGVV
jgi:hypothetical protein